jgi:hypothetical protein
MDPIAEMADRLDRDRYEAAKAMTFEQRAMAGVAMFELCLSAMRAGIQIQNPGIEPSDVEAIVLDRLRNVRRFENWE